MNGILDGLLAILGFCYYALLALWAFVSQVLLPVLSIGLLVIAFLLVAVVLRTLLQPRKYSNYYPEPDPEREQLCAEKLSAMVQVETVSTRGVSEPEKFRRLHAVMRDTGERGWNPDGRGRCPSDARAYGHRRKPQRGSERSECPDACWPDDS